MPSFEHEFVLEMFKTRPELAPQLMAGRMGVTVPAFDEVRVDSGEFTVLAPTKYWADSVLTLLRAGRPVLGVILEVQLHPVRKKRARWVAYLGNLHNQRACPVVLLVVCPSPKMAAWSARPYSIGHPGLVLTPVVLGPDRVPVVTDSQTARGNPELAVLSALAHGGEDEHVLVLPALRAGLDEVDEDRAKLYADFVLNALPQSARKCLEELMVIKTYEYQSDFARRYVSEGEARTLLMVLGARGIEIPDDIRERITTCTDLKTIDEWARRAATATSLDDVFV